MPRPQPCPCGAALSYDDHCGPLHCSNAIAATAEDLMRSRYSAFALGDARYLLDTWHPSTRPKRLDLDPRVRWIRLEIVYARGGPYDVEGTVEFRAWNRHGVQHERSAFLRYDGRWYYFDG